MKALKKRAMKNKNKNKLNDTKALKKTGLFYCYQQLLIKEQGGCMNIIVPLNKRVIVEPEAKEEKSKGGIIIPDTANQKAPTKGRVIAVAENADIKIRIQPGDIVLFPKFAGTEIITPSKEVGGKDRMFQIMKEEDILAVIRTNKD